MLGIPLRGMIVIGVLGAAGLMYVANGGKQLVPEPTAQECKVTVTADILNVRSGPADTQPIVATVQRDAVVKAERLVQNGFRLLSDGRWVNDQFVTPTSDSNCA
ncbi:SH3 domain-containing protein [Saccharothrix sp.]|uniref:SH3 domain-containing protein n=1 Tax=Saccharothrix sp. TaxID=1873460 RepID=UPI00281263EC|nr:SH3 domain-containing protein [Saccharothrix sp.]